MTGIWKKWMISWIIYTGILGMILIGAAFSSTDLPLKIILELAGYDFTLTDMARFGFGVQGALIIAICNFVAAGFIFIPETRESKGFWRTILMGMVAWFIIDGLVSILANFHLNLVSNLIIFIWLLIPMIGSGQLVEKNGSKILNN